MRLRVAVLAARDLLGKDRSGLSDPYCVVVWGGTERGRTRVVEQCLNPEWHEEFTIDDREGGGDLVVDCFDEDFGRRDDFLGRVVVPFAQLEGLPVDRREDLKRRTATNWVGYARWLDVVGRSEKSNVAGALRLGWAAMDPDEEKDGDEVFRGAEGDAMGDMGELRDRLVERGEKLEALQGASSELERRALEFKLEADRALQAAKGSGFGRWGTGLGRAPGGQDLGFLRGGRRVLRATVVEARGVAVTGPAHAVMELSGKGGGGGKRRTTPTPTATDHPIWEEAGDFVLPDMPRKGPGPVLTIGVAEEGTPAEGVLGEVAFPLKACPWEGRAGERQGTWYELHARGSSRDRVTGFVRVHLAVFTSQAEAEAAGPNTFAPGPSQPVRGGQGGGGPAKGGAELSAEETALLARVERVQEADDDAALQSVLGELMQLSEEKSREGR